MWKGNDEYHKKLEKVIQLNKASFALIKKVVEDGYVVLKQLHASFQLNSNHATEYDSERGRSETLQLYVSDLPSLVITFKYLLCTSRSEERIVSDGVAVLNSQRRCISQHQPALRSKKARF